MNIDENDSNARTKPHGTKLEPLTVTTCFVYLGVFFVLLQIVDRVFSRPEIVVFVSSRLGQGLAVSGAAALGLVIWKARIFLYRTLTSSAFSISILGSILTAVVFGTLIVQSAGAEEFAKLYGTHLSSVLVGLGMDDIFHSTWFSGLLVLLAISLVLVVVKKKMWKLPKWGYLLSHLGVVLILAGGFVGYFFGFKGFIDIHEGESTNEARSTKAGPENGMMHPLGFSLMLEDFEIELYEPEHRLYVYKAAGDSFRAVKSYGLDEADDWVSLAADFEFKVNKYYPDYYISARLIEAPAGKGRPALAMKMNGQDVHLFAQTLASKAVTLSPGVPSLRFLWEAPGADEVAPLSETRAGVHTVIFEESGSPREEVSVAPGGSYFLASGRHHLRVLDYLPDFVYDMDAKQPSTRSMSPHNPALYVAVDGAKRWLFARMPDYGKRHGQEADSIHLEYRYAASVEPAALEYFIVGKTLELWKLEAGEVAERRALAMDGGIPELKASGLKVYEFASEVRENASRSDDWNNPAVEIGLRHGDTVRNMLLRATHSEPLRLPDGKTIMAFEKKPEEAKSYRSKVAVLDGGTKVLGATVAVNSPLSYQGYLFYQSNYRKEDLTYSGFQVVRDPGLSLVWLGFIMISAGIIFALYIRPRILLRRREHVV